MPTKMDAAERGSITAKDGFRNEDGIAFKFNNWREDREAKEWLHIMGYDIAEIEDCKAVRISGYKTDVQVQVTIFLKEAIRTENIQVKLVSNTRGFNQIAKHRVTKYEEEWNMPPIVTSILKRYVGEEPPNIPHPKDSRRMFANEFTKEEQNTIVEWLKAHQLLIVAFVIRGKGAFAAEWLLVAQKSERAARWVLKDINFCMNFFGNGEVEITERGNFRIGRITMQRKGGDGGRKTAQMLQFKVNPAELFDV